MNNRTLLFLLSFLLGFACQSPQNQSAQKQTASVAQDQPEKTDAPKNDLPLDKIQLPEGFKIAIFAEVENARSLVIGEQGTIFVGNRSKDKVYALRDEDGDHYAEKVYVIDKGLKMPCGVAFREGSLYVAEIDRILRYDNIEANLENPPKPVIVNDQLPNDRWHGWKYIAFGPDDKLYVPVGAPCNVCEREKEIYASIARMNPDGSELEIFAKGVRNSVGFDWHPDTKELWFTDNGRDMMGDDLPDDELNHAPKAGMHFGFPYCHGGDISDPEFGEKRPCTDFAPPAAKLGAHVAAIGMRFYEGEMFPAAYQKQIFIARHGSWNRSRKVGYDVCLVQLEGNKAQKVEPFATGWLDEESQKAWGRPADVQMLADGSLLVSDDFANVVYRIWYEGS